MRQAAGPVAARLRRLTGLGRLELEESAGIGAAPFDAEEACPLLDRKQKQKQSTGGMGLAGRRANRQGTPATVADDDASAGNGQDRARGSWIRRRKGSPRRGGMTGPWQGKIQSRGRDRERAGVRSRGGEATWPWPAGGRRGHPRMRGVGTQGGSSPLKTRPWATLSGRRRARRLRPARGWCGYSMGGAPGQRLWDT